MERGELLKGLEELYDHAQNDEYLTTPGYNHLDMIYEAIKKELEGTRSIEEVRERLTALNYLNHDKMSEVWASRQTELKWFLKEDE